MLSTFFASRRTLMTSASLLLVGGSALCSAPQAHADEYLVGAEQFAATSTGATSSTVFLSSTNSSNGITGLDITMNGVTQSQGISFALSGGSNAISFSAPNSPPFSSYGGSNGDLGLFFSSTNTPYDPSSGARTPDLLISRATDGSTAFFFPAAGTTIEDYIYPGTTTANGATSFTVGTASITATQYSVADNTVGTLTLSVNGTGPAATPEPGSVAMLVGMGVTGFGFAVRRKRRK